MHFLEFVSMTNKNSQHLVECQNKKYPIDQSMQFDSANSVFTTFDGLGVNNYDVNAKPYRSNINKYVCWMNVQ